MGDQHGRDELVIGGQGVKQGLTPGWLLHHLPHQAGDEVWQHGQPHMAELQAAEEVQHVGTCARAVEGGEGA